MTEENVCEDCGRRIKILPACSVCGKPLCVCETCFLEGKSLCHKCFQEESFQYRSRECNEK